MASTLSGLNLDYVNWQPCANFDYKSNRAEVVQFMQEAKLDPRDDIKDIRLSTRLGSESTVGIVMKYAPLKNKNALFALKVMPGSLTDISVRREIATSRYLASSGSSYYPGFYGFGSCSQTFFKGEEKPIPSVYIFYEILAFDLNQLLDMLPTMKISEDDLGDLFVRVFLALEDLGYRRVLHPDTHTGNIMFRCVSQINIEPVIIDFGSCMIPDEIFNVFDPTPSKKKNQLFFKQRGHKSKESRMTLNAIIDQSPGYTNLLNILADRFGKNPLIVKFPVLAKAFHYTKSAKTLDAFDNPIEYRLFFQEVLTGNSSGKFSKLLEQIKAIKFDVA